MVKWTFKEAVLSRLSFDARAENGIALLRELRTLSTMPWGEISSFTVPKSATPLTPEDDKNNLTNPKPIV
jgi:hypothetical protein